MRLRLKVFDALVAACLSAGAAAGLAQPPPAPTEEARAEETQAEEDMELLWERDFELLLDMRDLPTRGQVLRAARRAELEREKEALRARLITLTERLDALEKSHSSETIMEEMLLQEVHTPKDARRNLQEEAQEVRELIRELDYQLRKLDGEAG